MGHIEYILVPCVTSKHSLHGMGIYLELTTWGARFFSDDESISFAL